MDTPTGGLKLIIQFSVGIVTLNWTTYHESVLVLVRYG